MSALQHKVGIFIFDDVEVLDFCGPWEVFSVTGRPSNNAYFQVYTMASTQQLITARHGLKVVPHYDLQNVPPPDILVIPGGLGTRVLLENKHVLSSLKTLAESAQLVLSVCTGALLLAKLGLLDHLKATTHHSALELLKSLAPTAQILADKKYVDNGRVIVAGGISAGIDMSLHVVERILGRAEAEATARYMEYDITA